MIDQVSCSFILSSLKRFNKGEKSEGGELSRISERENYVFLACNCLFSLSIFTLYMTLCLSACVRACVCVQVLGIVYGLCGLKCSLSISGLHSQEADPYLLNSFPQARNGECEETYSRTIKTLPNRRWVKTAHPAKNGVPTGCMAK